MLGCDQQRCCRVTRSLFAVNRRTARHQQCKAALYPHSGRSQGGIFRLKMTLTWKQEFRTIKESIAQTKKKQGKIYKYPPSKKMKWCAYAGRQLWHRSPCRWGLPCLRPYKWSVGQSRCWRLTSRACSSWSLSSHRGATSADRDEREKDIKFMSGPHLLARAFIWSWTSCFWMLRPSIHWLCCIAVFRVRGEVGACPGWL